jgi:hypothetical protein
VTIFGKEPALVIGTIVTIIVGIVSTLANDGFISDLAAGRLTDLVNGAGQLLLLLLPLITAAIIRTQVTPANPPAA